MTNPTGKGGFQERKHQINRLGRPKAYDEFQALIQSLLNEPAMSNGQPVIINGKAATVGEVVARNALKNPKMLATIWAYAYGKPKETIEVSGKDGGPVATEIIIKYADDNDTPAARGATADTRQREAV